MLRHYLHLSQETLGMMGISLFGTCTMKYNPRVNEQLAGRPGSPRCTRDQDDSTLQGVLEIVHGFDLMLRDLSGMDRFVFQPGGGADAAYTHACVTRAYLAARGELGSATRRDHHVQAHPCNPATAAAAGFKVVTLPLEEDGYPSLEALRAAVSERTAALMVNNPDDMGIYNPHIKEWVRTVHEAGGLCFYDHANFNGVMGRIRAASSASTPACSCSTRPSARPRAAAGPAVGAYGCTEELALPAGPARRVHARRVRPPRERRAASAGCASTSATSTRSSRPTRGCGRWAPRASSEAADLSVLANNYMETRLLDVRGVTRPSPR